MSRPITDTSITVGHDLTRLAKRDIADARVRAAAPELLEALEHLLEWANIGDHATPQTLQLRSEARAAIAKARGE